MKQGNEQRTQSRYNNGYCWWRNPVSGVTGSRPVRYSWVELESGRLRFGHAFSLRAFLSLNNLKLYIVAFLKTFVAVRLDGAIVNKNIRAIVTANETEALCIVKPFDFTFNSRHDPDSTWFERTNVRRPEPPF